MLTEHVSPLSDEQQRGILCENVADLYQIDLAALSQAQTQPQTQPQA